MKLLESCPGLVGVSHFRLRLQPGSVEFQFTPHHLHIHRIGAVGCNMLPHVLGFWRY